MRVRTGGRPRNPNNRCPPTTLYERLERAPQPHSDTSRIIDRRSIGLARRCRAGLLRLTALSRLGRLSPLGCNP